MTRRPRSAPLSAWIVDASAGAAASAALALLLAAAGDALVRVLPYAVRTAWLRPLLSGLFFLVASAVAGWASLRSLPRGGGERRSGWTTLLLGGFLGGAVLTYALTLAPDGPVPMHHLAWSALLAVPMLVVVQLAGGLAAQVAQARSQGRPAEIERLFRGTVWALALSAGALFTAVKIYQYRHWLVGAWDLGIYFTAMAAIGRGDWLGRTSLVGGPVLTDAGQWILYLLAPLFRIGGPVGGPWLMFALQGFALGVGAVPLALMAWRAWGRSWWALAMLPAIWAFPGTVATVAIDWHPDTLAFAFLTWALWAHDRNRAHLYYVLVALALLSKNQAVVPVVGMALWQLIAAFRRRDGLGLRRGLVTLAVSLGFFLLSEEVVLRVLGPGDKTILANYGHLGASVPAILANLVLHPGSLLDAVAKHADTWALLLGSLAWLPLLAPVRALPALAVLLVDSLSRFPLPNLPYSQYPLWALPFLAAATVDAASGTARRFRWAPEATAALLLVAATVVTVHWSLPMELWRFRPPAPRVVAALDAAVRRIPADAVVYGQTGTVGHLWDRPWVGAEPYDTFSGLLHQARRTESPVYVLFAPGVSYAPIVPLDAQWADLRAILASHAFEPLFVRDGVYLYRSTAPASRLETGGKARPATPGTGPPNR